MPEISSRMKGLITLLDEGGSSLSPGRIREALERSGITWEDVAPFVEERAQGYARRRVVRREHYELLVMTWSPGQASVPHDHAGSVCGVLVERGLVHETRFQVGPDGLAEGAEVSDLGPGGVIVDPGTFIHRLENRAGARGALVTLHVYTPPLAELRRYTERAPGRVAGVFERSARAGARRVVVVGGGFSGTMTAAQLIQRAAAARSALDVTIIDHQTSVGEGIAYRTGDAAHLLNVPAARMSAWPDKPGDFLDWARAREPSTAPYDFLARRLYGEYIRDTFQRTARGAGESVSARVRLGQALGAQRTTTGWAVDTSDGTTVEADALVIAVGHRLPADPLKKKWTGPRARYIGDPWATLAIGTIEPDEPVVLLGTGLTAVDVLLSLGKQNRTAPVIAISRRGLLPFGHAPAPVTPVDLAHRVNEWLAGGPGSVRARDLMRKVCNAIKEVERAGGDWRSVIDGLRPHTARLWQGLSELERDRFIRHVRPYWEVRRHRMAPAVAARVEAFSRAGIFRVMAGHIAGVSAGLDEVSVRARPRSAASEEVVRASWVINCTGPNSDATQNPNPVIASLIAGGELVPDPLGLGVLTGENGRAIGRDGALRSDLIVVGTLCKPALWESTAVPELRGQAADAASLILSGDAVGATT